MTALTVVAAFLVVFLLIVLRGAPWVPTHQRELDKLFNALDIDSSDLLVDLGSGDGRVLAAAARRGAKAVGYELNPVLVLVSRVLTRHLSPRPHVVWADYKLANWPLETTVIYLFGTGRDAIFLRKKLKLASSSWESLKVVTYGFRLSGLAKEDKVGAHYIYSL